MESSRWWPPPIANESPKRKYRRPRLSKLDAEIGPAHAESAIGAIVQLVDPALPGRRDQLAEVLGIGLLELRRIDGGRRRRHAQQDH